MEIFIFWIIFVCVIGWWASEWKRSVVGFVALAIVLSPILAAIVLLIKGRNTELPPPG